MKQTIRSTLLKTALSDKAKAMKMLCGGWTRPSQEMMIGTLAHAALLEPEKFKEEYEIFEGDNRNTKKIKLIQSRGKKPLKIAQAKEIDRMVNKTLRSYIAQHPELKNALENSEKELEITHEDDNYIHTARIDALSPDYLIEYKTSRIPYPEKKTWLQQVWDFSYDLQAYYYYTLLEKKNKAPAKGIIHLVQSTEEPYLAAHFFIPISAIKTPEMEQKYRTALSIVEELIEQKNKTPNELDDLSQPIFI